MYVFSVTLYLCKRKFLWVSMLMKRWCSFFKFKGLKNIFSLNRNFLIINGGSRLLGNSKLWKQLGVRITCKNYPELNLTVRYHRENLFFTLNFYFIYYYTFFKFSYHFVNSTPHKFIFCMRNFYTHIYRQILQILNCNSSPYWIA